MIDLEDVPIGNGKPRLHGEGALARAGDGWLDFLSRLGGDRRAEHCFVARNFVLDEGVSGERRESYREKRCMLDHGSYVTWRRRHEDYLSRELRVPSDDGPPSMLDPVAPEEIPETFRAVDASSPFLRTDPGVMLVRVEEIAFVAGRSGESAETIEALAREIVAARPKHLPAQEAQLNAIFETWHVESDQRPVFAGFWADLDDVFEAGDGDAAVAMLRDRLGLAHLDPGLRGGNSIPVLVFRYPVQDVPRILGTGGRRRPLVTPTVLDGPFSTAFCPSPRGAVTGHVLNLAPEQGNLRREVVHPRPTFRVSHLHRVGRIRRPVDRGRLGEQRAFHLLLMRDESGREDYAEGTDRDLLE